MDDRLLDALAERSRDQAGGLRLTGEGSMLGELVKAVLERALEAELTAHLGYARNDRAGRGGGGRNYRNGSIAKTVQTGVGPVPLAVPRDRAGTFEPLLVPKRAGRVAGGLDDMIISLYAHGMSVRDILHHLEQVYGTQLSRETVSRITDGVLEEVRAWQSRPLDPVSAVAFPAAIMVKGPGQPGGAEQARLPGRRHRRRRGEARAGHLAGQDRRASKSTGILRALHPE
jgi:transposase-like protein